MVLAKKIANVALDLDAHLLLLSVLGLGQAEGAGFAAVVQHLLGGSRQLDDVPCGHFHARRSSAAAHRGRRSAATAHRRRRRCTTAATGAEKSTETAATAWRSPHRRSTHRRSAAASATSTTGAEVLNGLGHLLGGNAHFEQGHQELLNGFFRRRTAASTA